MECPRIPKHVDDPGQFFFWEIDEAIPVIAGFTLGAIFNSILLFTFCGIVISRLVAKLKEGKHRGFMLHFLYWHGVPGFKLKEMPDSWVRAFCE